MTAGSFDKMDGNVEADETYVGGLAKNMHERKRKERVTGRGGDGKAIVMGILQRTTDRAPSRVITRHIKDANLRTLHGAIRENVTPGASLMTDSWAAYRGLGADYIHEVVNHAEEYVRGNIHTNGIENFWSLLKRTVKGTYVSVDPVHLARYLGRTRLPLQRAQGQRSGPLPIRARLRRWKASHLPGIDRPWALSRLLKTRTRTWEAPATTPHPSIGSIALPRGCLALRARN
jgi:transposase-like protein